MRILVDPRLFITVLCAALAVACVGCAAFGEPKATPPDLQAEVEVSDTEEGYEGETLFVVVEGSESAQEDAIGALRAELWRDAIEEFEALNESETNDDKRAQNYFGIGVAYEVLGDYQQALEAHRSALRLANKAEYDDAMKRAKRALDRSD